jgi:hypothetical protein
VACDALGCIWRINANVASYHMGVGVTHPLAMHVCLLLRPRPSTDHHHHHQSLLCVSHVLLKPPFAAVELSADVLLWQAPGLLCAPQVPTAVTTVSYTPPTCAT